GSFWTKRRNEDVTARFHGPRYSGDVAPPILRVAQEMEHGPVVPKVVSLCREPDLSDVRDEPPNRGRPIAEARLRGFDSLRRDIEHADVDVPARQEVVDQGRRTTVDIDDGRLSLKAGLLYKPE